MVELVAVKNGEEGRTLYVEPEKVERLKAAGFVVVGVCEMSGLTSGSFPSPTAREQAQGAGNPKDDPKSTMKVKLKDKPKPGDRGASDGDRDRDELGGMKAADLLSVASAEGVRLPTGATKAQAIDAILAARAESAEGDE